MELEPATVFKDRVSKGLREGALIVSVLLCLYTLLALISYDTNDPGWTQAVSDDDVKNYTGVAGAWLADVLLTFVGYISFLLPIMLAYYAWTLLRREESNPNEFHWGMVSIRLLGFGLLIASGASLAHLFLLDVMQLPHSSGGIIGASISDWSLKIFNLIGSVLVLVAIFLFGMTAFADISWLSLVDNIGAMTLKALRVIGGSSVGAVQKAVEKNKEIREKKDSIAEKARALVNVPALADLRISGSSKEAELEPEDAIVIEAEELEKGKKKSRKRTLKKVEPVMSDTTLPDIEEADAKGSKKKRGNLFSGKTIGSVPKLDVLDLPKHPQKRGFTDEDLEKMSRLLEEKLKDFGVVAEVVGVCPGPVITRFEIQPAPGV